MTNLTSNNIGYGNLILVLIEEKSSLLPEILQDSLTTNSFHSFQHDEGPI